MSFKSNLTNDLSIFFNSDEFSEEIVYLSEDSSSNINIDAHIEYLNDLEITAEGSCQKAICFVKKTDIVSQYLDTIWIGGIKWIVDKIDSEDDYVSKLYIRRDERLGK